MEPDTTNQLVGLVLFSVLMVPVSLTLAPAAAMAAGSWQEKQLFEPGASQLNRESKGLVTIYSGFTDIQVAEAVDHQFDRVENMMFVNTVVTAPGGAPKKDKKSGEVQTEDDGC